MAEERDTGRLSEEDIKALIEEFESMGFMTFRADEDEAQYDALMKYIRHNLIPTFTDVDEAERTITITKRPMGSLELF